MLLVCTSSLNAVSMHIRCVDAAREAARLAARGDDGSAAAHAIAPHGAAVQLRRDGDYVLATVSAKSAFLPGITVAGRAVAAVESPAALMRALLLRWPSR